MRVNDLLKLIMTIGILLSGIPITAHTPPYGGTVCTGRTWDYVINSREPQEYHSVLSEGYCFKGVQQFQGKEYAVFCDPEDTPLAMMREEAGKVYLYVPGEDEKELPGYGIHIDAAPGEESVAGDVLLYDFTLEVGDRFTMPCFPDNGDLAYAMMMEFEVKSVSTHEFKAEEYATLEIECVSFPAYKTYTVIEGVGCPEGLLPFPQIANYTSCLQSTSYALYEVADAEGVILYKNSEVLPSGINTISDFDPNGKTVVYDLYGQPVNSHQSGRIYISNGKKFILSK